MAKVNSGRKVSLIRKAYQAVCKIWIRLTVFPARKSGKISPEWEQVLRAMGDEFPSIHTQKMIHGFLSERIILKKTAETESDRSAPTVICVEKDSLVYLKRFLPYYRNLGIHYY